MQSRNGEVAAWRIKPKNPEITGNPGISFLAKVGFLQRQHGPSRGSRYFVHIGAGIGKSSALPQLVVSCIQIFRGKTKERRRTCNGVYIHECFEQVTDIDENIGGEEKIIGFSRGMQVMEDTIRIEAGVAALL